MPLTPSKNTKALDDCMTFVFILIVITLASLTSGYLGYAVCERTMQQKIIDHGYAEYNSNTGDWQWIEPENTDDINSSEQELEQKGSAN